MKRFSALTLLITILLSVTTNFAQNSSASIPQSPAAELKASVNIAVDNQEQIKQSVDRNRVIRRLLAEVSSGRALLKSYREREDALQLQLAGAEKSEQKLSAAHDQAVIEIKELRAKIFDLEKALATREIQLMVLREDRTRLQSEVKTLRRQVLVLTVGGALGIAALVYLLK